MNKQKLPDLVGTRNQIIYADSLRTELFDSLDEIPQELRDQASAVWWINNYS